MARSSFPVCPSTVLRQCAELLLSVVMQLSRIIPEDRKRRWMHSPQEEESKRMIATIQLDLQVNTIPGFSRELWQFLSCLGFCPGSSVSGMAAAQICKVWYSHCC